MNHISNLKKSRDRLTILILLITVICSIAPLITKGMLAQKSMITAFGEEIQFYGKGLYARNSFSMAIQAIAQDMVNLILVVPLTVISLISCKKEKMIAQFTLTGLLGYLLYTYMSYAFLMFYNSFFLLYVINMALSFYAFVISILILNEHPVIEKLEDNMKTKGLRIFLNLTGLFIAMMWLGRIIPTIGTDLAPAGLENYSTLGIQVLDLGVIVPACFVISHLLKVKSRLGYIFAPVLIIKAVALVIAVLTMAVCMTLSGVEVAPVEYIVFGIVCIFAVFYLVRILAQMKHISEGNADC